MKATTNRLILVIFAIFLGANISIAQDKKAAEPTLDEQIKSAEAEEAKLKALNKILENNARIRAYNKRLQAGGEVETTDNAPTAKKDDENKPTETVTASGKTADSKVPKETTAEKPKTADEKKNLDFIPETKTTDTNKTDDKTNGNTPANGGGGSSGAETKTAAAANDGEADFATKACDKILKNSKSAEVYASSVCRLAYSLAVDSNHQLSPKGDVALTSALFERVIGKNSANKSIEAVLVDVESKKADKQVGSDAGNTGTTNLATGARIPMAFNFAVENGLATQQSDGTTINFRFNPVGLVEMLNKQSADNIDFFSESDPLVKHLRRTAFGLSYDTARGVKLPVFTGSRDQLSGMSFSYGFLNQREPTDSFIKQEVDRFGNTVTAAFQDSAIETFKKLQDEAVVTNFISKLNTELGGKDAKKTIDDQAKVDAKAAIDKMAADKRPAENTDEYTNLLNETKAQIIYSKLYKQFKEVSVDEFKKSDSLTLALTQFNRNLAAYQQAEKELRRKLLRARLLTFDYNYLRTFAANDMSNFKLVYEKGWETGMDLRFNSGFTVFHAPIIRTPTALAAPTAAGKQQRFRDFAFSGQLDLPLTGLTGAFGDSMLTLGVKWQRMLTESIFLFDGVTEIKNLKGNIILGQAKVNIPLFDGFSVPLSFTYANRPELTKLEKQSRGNFGFTFDLSSLLQRFNPFQQLINKSNK